jgi:hypothetical protein
MRAATIFTGVLYFGFTVGCLAGGTAPTSNGRLFFDDFSDGTLDKWDTQNFIIDYDSSRGNPAGSLRVEGEDFSEPVGRAKMLASTTEVEWVAELDFMLDSGSDAGMWFLIYAGYAAGAGTTVGVPVDVEIGVDSSVDFQTSGQPWDFHVYHWDENLQASVTTSIDANLEWDTWYHFTVHRVFASTTADVYLDGNLVGAFAAFNPTERIGDAQIGDPGSVQFGYANWDNVSIGSTFEAIPPPSITDVAVGDTVLKCFASMVGIDYALEFSEAASPTDWMPTGLVITGDGNTRYVFDPAGVSATRTYRLDVLPQ